MRATYTFSLDVIISQTILFMESQMLLFLVSLEANFDVTCGAIAL